MSHVVSRNKRDSIHGIHGYLCEDTPRVVEPDEADLTSYFKPAFGALHGLGTLCLTGCPEHSMPALAALVATAPDLRSLTVETVTAVRAEDFPYAVSGGSQPAAVCIRLEPFVCTRLTSLDVTYAVLKPHMRQQLRFTLADAAALERCLIRIEGVLLPGDEVVINFDRRQDVQIRPFIALALPRRPEAPSVHPPPGWHAGFTVHAGSQSAALPGSVQQAEICFSYKAGSEGQVKPRWEAVIA